MTLPKAMAAVVWAVALAGCGADQIGQPPAMSAIGAAGPGDAAIITAERAALAVPPPQSARMAYQQASLWNTGPDGLLGDRRASQLGDLLTVVIEIDEEAEMRNSTQRTRSGSESVEVGGVFGIGPDEIGELKGLDGTFDVTGDSSYRGNGTTRRNEKLTLRVAATVVDVLPNGQLVIQGDQEVRVNNELRELRVAGIVRPGDISRYNEIPYDRIAGARISYGGRGQITAAQQPRWGQQVSDILLPY